MAAKATRNKYKDTTFFGVRMKSIFSLFYNLEILPKSMFRRRTSYPLS